MFFTGFAEYSQIFATISIQAIHASEAGMRVNDKGCTMGTHMWQYNEFEKLLPESEMTIFTEEALGLYVRLKAADDDAGKLQPVFLKRLYLLHICIFSFFLFTASLTTI